MNIHFYLEEEEETEITSFYDMQSNPFKIGDEISLDVNEDLLAKFKRKKIKIVKEGKYVRVKSTSEGKLTIEYHCVLI